MKNENVVVFIFLTILIIGSFYFNNQYSGQAIYSKEYNKMCSSSLKRNNPELYSIKCKDPKQKLSSAKISSRTYSSGTTCLRGCDRQQREDASWCGANDAKNGCCYAASDTLGCLCYQSCGQLRNLDCMDHYETSSGSCELS